MIEAKDWLLKMNSEFLTRQERAEFEAWLAEHPEHHQKYHLMSEVWNGADVLKDHPPDHPRIVKKPGIGTIRYASRPVHPLLFSSSRALETHHCIYCPDNPRRRDMVHPNPHRSIPITLSAPVRRKPVIAHHWMPLRTHLHRPILIICNRF